MFVSANAMKGTATVRLNIDLTIRFTIYQFVLLAKVGRKFVLTLNLSWKKILRQFFSGKGADPQDSPKTTSPAKSSRTPLARHKSLTLPITSNALEACLYAINLDEIGVRNALA